MGKAFTIFIVMLILLTLLLIISSIFLDLDIRPDSQCRNIPNLAYRVIDGDTLQYYDELGFQYTVRLLCVDTPEVGQKGYFEAKEFLEEQVLCREISIELSDFQELDKYGRVLAWVYYTDDSGNRVLLNKLILDEGYGDLLVIPPQNCDEVRG